jgi:hypothetical protein
VIGSDLDAVSGPGCQAGMIVCVSSIYLSDC